MSDFLNELKDVNKLYTKKTKQIVPDYKIIENLYNIECFLNNKETPQDYKILQNAYKNIQFEDNIEQMNYKQIFCFIEMLKGSSIFERLFIFDKKFVLSSEEKQSIDVSYQHFQQIIDSYFNTYLDVIFKLLVHNDGVYLNIEDAYEQDDTLKYIMFILNSKMMTKRDILEAMRYFIIFHAQQIRLKL